MQVVAVVIRRGNCYLVGKRPAHKHHGGLWEFPGGKCEPGETLEAAARRELREELRATLGGVGDVLAVVSAGGITLHFIEATLDDEEPRALEHEALRWCDPAELLDLPLAPLDRLFVAGTLSGTG
jgi:8-oxo-dGTP pyrophosphatase MutT (NUDIX family)